MASELTFPLAGWAQSQLAGLAQLTGSPAIAKLDAATLIGERAMYGGYRVPGTTSAGKGSSRLMPTADGRWFALTLSRTEDRELLPALFGDARFDGHDDTAIPEAVLKSEGEALLTQARTLGLAAALADEECLSAPYEVLARGSRTMQSQRGKPLVLDLSSVWAGPLAAHLLWHAGAEVVKIENPNRPDRMREGDPELFALLAQGKANVAIDPTIPDGRDALLALIGRADIVIESSRPRALAQLGIDASALVAEQPGLVWLNITAHGASGEAAHWCGFGHECGVAAGLAGALQQATGEIGFVGDALPDPLTGIHAARIAWTAWQRGDARRLGVSLTGVAAHALASERLRDPAALVSSLRTWNAVRGQPFPTVGARALTHPVRAIGADNEAWMPC